MALLLLLAGILLGAILGALLGSLLGLLTVYLFPGLVELLAGRSHSWRNISVSIVKGMFYVGFMLVAAVVGGILGAPMFK